MAEGNALAHTNFIINTNMDIKYNARSFKTGLIIGIAFLLVGIASIVFGETPSLFFLGAGVAYIAIGIYRMKANYVTIADGFLKKDFGGKILLKDVTEIRRFAGDYIFKTANSEVTIDTNAVDKNSLKELEEFVATCEAKCL
jgi:hypothetical protein